MKTMKVLTSFLAFVMSAQLFALDLGSTLPTMKVTSMEKKSSWGLDSLKGKIVVLEWLNHGCPFVRKHYDSGNMQKLQGKWTAQDVVWISVISSAEGKQGYSTASVAREDKEKNKALSSDIILDATGALGRHHGAETTPHFFIYNAEGKLAYQGAIDDKASTSASDIPQSKNYIDMALNDLKAGKKVQVAQTKAYGCGVKY
jgi:hypothetical protein